MTPEQTALLARLDDKFHEDILPTDLERAYLPDYNNLNNLMPLAWNHGVDCDQELDGTWSAKAYINKDNPRHGVLDITDANPKKAIQQALLAIARDKFK